MYRDFEISKSQTERTPVPSDSGVFNGLLIPYLGAVALACWRGVSPAAELLLLGALAALSSAVHIAYGAGVVREMCKHFNRRCFHIKPHIK
ncbi:unnamed protein product [Plutella xylostella]|uniref:(diamondback moth) hypothetical protein n=1 Tax=Plutella xylostella TaxID=51655 RepID=A0A8S4EVR4_PLUXY|nr:unnamed protein product [Plutella xylostella]